MDTTEQWKMRKIYLKLFEYVLFFIFVKPAMYFIRLDFKYRFGEEKSECLENNFKHSVEKAIIFHLKDDL